MSDIRAGFHDLQGYQVAVVTIELHRIPQADKNHPVDGINTNDFRITWVRYEGNKRKS